MDDFVQISWNAPLSRDPITDYTVYIEERSGFPLTEETYCDMSEQLEEPLLVCSIPMAALWEAPY